MKVVVDVDGPRTGRENMAEDERRSLDALTRDAVARVRLYAWNPPCISIGFHQSDGMIDADKAANDGIDVVRRPTGGGAILHAQELTYAITLPLGSMRPGELYALTARALLAGLESLGVWAENFDANGGRFETTQSCFSGIAKNEIRVGGKKLIGSAQRVFRVASGSTSVLQHGSILLGAQHADLAVYMRDIPPMNRADAVRGLRERSTDLAAVLRRPVSFDEAAGAMLRSFETKFESVHIERHLEAIQ